MIGAWHEAKPRVTEKMDYEVALELWGSLQIGLVEVILECLKQTLEYVAAIPDEK